jgi:hypothetical protein
VLQALGERTAWEKALFLLATHPRLGGKTAVEVLRDMARVNSRPLTLPGWAPDALPPLPARQQRCAERGTCRAHRPTSPSRFSSSYSRSITNSLRRV